MRTSITLDDEVYEIASSYAAARRTTLGAAIGELVRQATSPAPDTNRSSFTIGPNGLPLLKSRGRGVITLEMVKAAQEDEID